MLIEVSAAVESYLCNLSFKLLTSYVVRWSGTARENRK